MNWKNVVNGFKRRHKKMKITFFLGCTNPYPGGGWIRVVSLAEYLKNRGFHTYIIGTFSVKNPNKAGSTIYNGLRIFNVVPTMPFKNIICSFFDILLSTITLSTLFIILKPDIIIISVPGHKLLTVIGAYIGAKLSGAKIVFDYRDEWEDMAIRGANEKIKPVLKLLKSLMSSLYVKSDFVLVNSPKFMDILKKREVKKIRLIFTGVDTTVFKPYNKKIMRQTFGLPHDAFIIVYSGLIGGCYRLEVVIKALSKAQVRNTHFIMIGSGPDIHHILRLADKVDLRITYLGVKKDKKEIARILSAADVGIIPYDLNSLWKNTIPTKFYEYCACGLPVIATAYKDSMLANLISENKIGLVCKPLDVEELAEAIERLSKDEKFREEAARRARLMVEEIFDRNKLTEEFLNIIVDLLRDK